MKNHKIFFLLIVIIITAGLIYYYFVQNRHLNNWISATGTIEALEVNLSSKFGGKIEELKVDEGATVKNGDILCQIEAKELIEQYNNTFANINLSTAQLENTKKELARIEALYKNNLASEQQLDMLKTQLKINEAQLKLADTSEKLIKLQLDDAQIKSPIDGFVTLKAAEAGETVAPGMPIFTIADLAHPWLTVYISEKDLGKIKHGQTAQVNIDSYPQEKFLGKIIFISQRAEFTPKNIQTKDERVTQVFAIKISLENPDFKLKPGMPADCVIALNNK